ncbi:MAG: EAL domain-containing protein, partial [Alkalispirochaetaceae bacterium]
VEYLSNLGFRIAMDDFGTGYSSLSSLRSLPLDRLKVDRSFVEGLPGDGRSKALLRVVRETCTALGLEMVAEGVEHSDQLEALSSIAPDLYQGYYFGRPATLDEILSTVPRSSRGRGRDSR